MLYRQNATVLTTPLPGGEVALLDTVTQNYYTLNETGGVVWNAFAEPASIDAAATELVTLYDVDPATANSAAQTVLADLVRDGLLKQLPPDADAP